MLCSPGVDAKRSTIVPPRSMRLGRLRALWRLTRTSRRSSARRDRRGPARRAAWTGSCPTQRGARRSRPELGAHQRQRDQEHEHELDCAHTERGCHDRRRIDRWAADLDEPVAEHRDAHACGDWGHGHDPAAPCAAMTSSAVSALTGSANAASRDASEARRMTRPAACHHATCVTKRRGEERIASPGADAR